MESPTKTSLAPLVMNDEERAALRERFERGEYRPEAEAIAAGMERTAYERNPEQAYEALAIFYRNLRAQGVLHESTTERLSRAEGLRLGIPGRNVQEQIFLHRWVMDREVGTAAHINLFTPWQVKVERFSVATTILGVVTLALYLAVGWFFGRG